MVLKKREKVLLVLAIIAVAIGAFDWFYYSPQKKIILNLKEQIKVADLKLKEYTQFTQGMETVEGDVSRLEKELQGWSERMLRGEEFRAFLRHLARDSDRLQMKIISLTPQEEKIPLPEGKKETFDPRYKRVAIQIVLHSTYPSLGTFLKGIEELPFLVTVDNLQIERNEETLPFLKVTLGLSVHVISS
jgi:Tfp pilus assembly protein PilO